MFEQQILCHKLPKSSHSINAYNNQEQWVNKRHEIIQDFKRRMLNIELGQSEIELQQYEHLYEQELTTFESETFKINSPYQMYRLDMLMYFVKKYLYHHTNIMIRQIRYKESCIHIKLSRWHQHHLLSTQKTLKFIHKSLSISPKFH
jgi:hypothetical protein